MIKIGIFKVKQTNTKLMDGNMHTIVVFNVDYGTKIKFKYHSKHANNKLSDSELVLAFYNEIQRGLNGGLGYDLFLDINGYHRSVTSANLYRCNVSAYKRICYLYTGDWVEVIRYIKNKYHL